MARKFLGGAYYRGECFNTCIYDGDGEPNAQGRFARTVRNRWGKIVGYREHTDRPNLEILPMESIGVAKAVALYNSRRMRLLRWARWVFRKLEQWHAARILWRGYR